MASSRWWSAAKALLTMLVLALILDSLAVAGGPVLLLPVLAAGLFLGIAWAGRSEP